jgi:hypothetical protein
MVIIYLLLMVLIIANLWATRQLIRNKSEFDFRKWLMLITLWLVPVLGIVLVRDRLRPPLQRDYAQLALLHERSMVQLAAASVLAGTSHGDFDVAAHLNELHGIPVLDWGALEKWGKSSFEGAELTSAIEQGRRSWLLHLCQRFGAEMHLYESNEAFVLSPLDLSEVSPMAAYVAKTRSRITRLLEAAAQSPTNEKCILLILDNEKDYYDYVAVYYPDGGEFAFSGGMFINSGCPHFVVVRAELLSIEPVIAHELTHMALSHLHLPRWLDEGIAVNTEIRLTGEKRSGVTPWELHRMHLDYWTQERIQEFWMGSSFFRTDAGNRLSYELARIMVDQLARDWKGFLRFVQTADIRDAGSAGLQQSMQLDLGALAAGLLEMPSPQGWGPNPVAWTTQQVST